MKYAIGTIEILALVICVSSQVCRGQTQGDLSEEAGKAARKADAALNATYKELLSLLDAEGKEKLKAAQRAWLKFRDAEAELAADEYRGGSAARMVYLQSIQELTEARTAQLKVHIKVRKDPR